ncbi:hypothetical protein CLOSTMETH_03455 [[Clostridium] methylpentosum DSM 5476]|uniref:Uncharacterized protein n=1 Tax=[Clostridium] methylpentosum DSM 5476 TaxID=537013 RepID=C0EHW0_9FIRM|nr:hypothetical protein CLOSTMETH_03455 [[Clostridium] methylpentosum DSM 5476]
MQKIFRTPGIHWFSLQAQARLTRAGENAAILLAIPPCQKICEKV